MHCQLLQNLFVPLCCFQVTTITVFNILMNEAVVSSTSQKWVISFPIFMHMNVSNISMRKTDSECKSGSQRHRCTLMSISKAVAPAVAGLM